MHKYHLSQSKSMDFLSKKIQKFSMKASGMSDEAIKDMEETQRKMEETYKKGGPSAVQEEYMKQMQTNFEQSQKMMEQAASKMSQPQTSIADELAKLAKLKEQGVISESEFQQMKQELIKKLTWKHASGPWDMLTDSKRLISGCSAAKIWLLSLHQK